MRAASPPVEALRGGLFLLACGAHLGRELAGSAAFAVRRPRFVPANGMTTRTGKRPPPRLGNPIMPAPQAVEIRKLRHHGFRRTYPRNARLARTTRLENLHFARRACQLKFRPHSPGLLHCPLGHDAIWPDGDRPLLACAAKVESSFFRCFGRTKGTRCQGRR